jgi:hypothetical protein
MFALRSGESGAYGELVKRPLPEGLRLFFIPSLAGMLFRAERVNGAALTEDEVLRIRDQMGVMVMQDDRVRAMEKKGLCRHRPRERLAELVAAAGGSRLDSPRHPDCFRLFKQQEGRASAFSRADRPEGCLAAVPL